MRSSIRLMYRLCAHTIDCAHSYEVFSCVHTTIGVPSYEVFYALLMRASIPFV